MAKSRYSNTQILDDRSFGTFRMPVRAMGLRELDLLAGVRSFEYTYKAGDRLDHLAARFFNDESYWWVIAMVNNIAYPFASGGLEPGVTLRIPHDVKDVLDKLFA